MPKVAFEPCIPTRGTKVPAGPDWLHEIKHDGYRLIVQREGKRVRLFTRNGNDWTARYPACTGDAKARNKTQSESAILVMWIASRWGRRSTLTSQASFSY